MQIADRFAKMDYVIDVFVAIFSISLLLALVVQVNCSF